MIKPWMAAIPGLTAMVCALSMVALFIKADDARKTLQLDSIDGFKLVTQADHNFDALAQNLVAFSGTGNTLEKDALSRSVAARFQVISDIFNDSITQGSGGLSSVAGATELFGDVQAFLNKHRSLLTPADSPGIDDVTPIVTESRELSHRFFDAGLILYDQKLLLRKRIASEMDTLYSWLAMLGVTFAVTSILTALLLRAMSKRTDSINEKALTTQSRLSTALDKLNTGDEERQALNRLVAAASHDLRQPLHALGLYLGALESHVGSYQGQLILQNSFRSTEALNHLLNSMLDLSKLDAGIIEVNLAHVRLNTVFFKLRQTFEPDAEQRGLKLDVEETDVVVHSDPVLLERILGNLVSNALAYTDQGTVSIRAWLAEERVQIVIADTGHGIPDAEQNRIFEEYYQLHNSERDRTKGLGLGLSIVKRLTRLLDIELSLKSAPASGSTFTLGVLAGSRELCDQLPASALNQTDTNLIGLSILVIDDETDVREGMSALLEQFGAEVISLDSAESSLKYLIEHQWVPDLIIADYRLRDNEKGDMAIEQIREEVNEDVPAMIITGDTSPERLKDANASGFTLLHKPVVAHALLSKINQTIGEHA
ncbi:MAG: ATP-binding protein [Granulosicoccus sp.]